MNKLSSFLDSYADYYKTIHKIGDYATQHDHFLLSKADGGGFAHLGESIHSDIQKSINRIVVSWSETNDASIRKSFEDRERKQLIQDIRNDISRNAEIKKDSAIKSYEHIAQDFVDMMFEPLLDLAKDIDKDLVVARHRGGKTR